MKYAELTIGKPNTPSPTLGLVVGGYFGVRSTFTVVLVRFFGSAPQVGAALSLAGGFCLLGLALVDLLRPPKRDTCEVSLPSSLLRWIVLYLAFTGVSLCWSEASSHLASLAYWTGTASDVMIMVVLARRSPPRELSISLMKGFIVGACIVACMAWLMPAQYDLRLGDEDYFNANTIANLCAFGFFFADALRRSGENFRGSISLFLAITVLRSLSKSTIAAFAISATYMLIRDRSLSRKAKAALIGLAVFIVLAFWGLFEAYYEVYTTTGNQAQTLTGRTAIWLFVLNSLPEHLWIGHGFDSMWKTIPAFGTFQARHAENELLEQLYAFGFAGTALFLTVYGSLYMLSRQLLRHPIRASIVSMLTYVVVRGFAEADPFDLLLPLWVIVMLGGLAVRAAQPSLIEREGAASARRESKPFASTACVPGT